MRYDFSKNVFAAVAAIALSAACSEGRIGEQSVPGEVENAGELGLALQISPTAIIENVEYSITGPGITPIQGAIPVRDPGATISATIGGIPAGTGYQLELHGVSVDGKTNCNGSANFAIVAGQTTQALVDFICVTGSGSGSTGVGTMPDNCPVLNFVSVAPSTVNVGGRIAASAAASDSDGQALAFSWTVSPVTAGSFASATSATTTFTCTSGGPAVLHVAATDGLCADDASVNVMCVNPGCGNGQIDPGETCDDGNRTAACDLCPPDCTLPVCGDGKVECGLVGAEICDDGNTNPFDNCDQCVLPVCGDGRRNGSEQCDGGPTCNASCQNIVCGDGRVDPPEACDPPGSVLPGGLVCGAICQAQGPVCVCGDGLICPSGGEQCERPNSPGNAAQPSGSAQGCGASCQNLLSATCVNCEAGTECVEFASGCEHSALNTPATEGPAMGTSRRALCYETAECVRRTGCASGSQGPLSCYCGMADAVTCLGGGAAVNGACKTELERSMESTSASTIAALRFGDPTYGGGMWMLRLTCDQGVGCSCP